MPENQQPVYTGTINSVPVRFYRPQSDEDMMPWVVLEDLASAAGLNRDARKALQATNRKHKDLAKRVGAEGGTKVDVLAFQGAQGLLGALKQVGVVGEAFHVEVVAAFMAAAERLHPLLFDRTAGGEVTMNSRMLSMLLGEDHEALADRIEAEGVVVKVVPGPRLH